MSSKQFVVVGGSKGIGFGIVQRLVAEGHAVHVLSRSADQLGDLPGVTHTRLDVTIDEVTAELFPEQVSGLAYCPGSINLKTFRALKVEDFRNDFEINLIGAVKCLQAATSALRKAGSSSVVMFSTVAVGQGLLAHASVAAAKGAVEGLTRTLACELAPSIRVNCIAPALTNTSLAARFFADEEKAKSLAEKYPLKRTGTVEDLSAMATFLLSDQSNWVTGQVLGVDGGMSTVRK